MRSLGFVILVVVFSSCGGGEPQAVEETLRGWEGEILDSETPTTTVPESLASAVVEEDTDEPDAQPITTTTVKEVEATADEQRDQAHAMWVSKQEAQAGPTMESCGYPDLATSQSGTALTPSTSACPTLTVPELPCSGTWGTVPGIDDVLVVLDGRADVFGDALRVPTFETPRAIVCVNTPIDRSVAAYLVPCGGDARIPTEEYKLRFGQRILRTTTEWYSNAASPIAVGADASFFGECTPPTTSGGDPSIDLLETGLKEDAELAGDRVVPFQGSWDQLHPAIERIDELGSLLDTTPSFNNDTCLAVSEYIGSFDHAVSNAIQSIGFPFTWLNEWGEYTGSDHTYPARLGTNQQNAHRLLRESTELGETLISDGFGDTPMNQWMAEAIETLTTLTDESWPGVVNARFSALNEDDWPDVYDALDSASADPEMAGQLELLGMISQVHAVAECTGQPEPRANWINPEFIFEPRLDEYDPMASSQLQPFSVDPIDSTCEATVRKSEIEELITLAAGRDVFGPGGRVNATAVSFTDDRAGEHAEAVFEEARTCGPEGKAIFEVRQIGSQTVIVSKDSEDGAEIWTAYLTRNNVSLRFAKWFVGEESTDVKQQRFLGELERFRSALLAATPEDEVFESDIR